MDYYALLVALVLLTAVLMHGNQQGNKKYVIVASLLLFAIYGLRDTYHIGFDSATSYLYGFKRIGAQPWSEIFANSSKYNFGFTLMTKAFHSFISADYQLYITTISVFVSICFGRLIYKYSPSPVQSILYHFGLLLYVFHFSALKQSIAMAFLMLAFDAITERKPVKFFLLVFIASQFHFPALVFLPAYFLPRLKIERYFLIALAVMLLLTYLFRNQIITFMLTMYKDENVAAVDLSNIRFLRTKALIMIVIVVAAILLRMPGPDDPVYTLLMKFIGIAIVFQTFCGYNNIFERLADYYFQFSVIFIPMAFDRNVPRRSMLSRRFVVLVDTLAPYAFCSFAIYRFLSYTSTSSGFHPYRFFFS